MATALAICCSGLPSHASMQKPQLSDGPAFSDHRKTLVCLNTFQPFGYGLSIGPPGSAVYDEDPFRNGGSDQVVMPKSRLALINSSGFDCLRMVIDVGALMSARSETLLDSLVAQIMIGISRRVDSGLRVIVDIHPFPRGAHPVSGFADVDLLDGETGEKFQRLIHVVSKLAISIGARFPPALVAIELFNEPPSPTSFNDQRPWNEQIEFYWKQIRLILPTHTLIVAGTGFAELDGSVSGDSSAGVVNLRPDRFDANTGYAIHPYESATFTHQGYAGFFSHVGGLEFPAAMDRDGKLAAENIFRRNVAADPNLTHSAKSQLIYDFLYRTVHSYSFEKYRTTFGNAELLLKRMNVVNTWADLHQLSRKQIMNTEFGVNRDQAGCVGKAPSKSAFNFVRAIRDNSFASGIGLITIHQMQGDCFAISSAAPPFAFEADMLEALRLPGR